MSNHFEEFVQDFFPESRDFFPDSSLTKGYSPQSVVPRILPRKRFSPRRVSRNSDEVYEVGSRTRKLEREKKIALRENPKLHQKATMLYVDAVVNGFKMPIFVDTGAQASVMSMKTCRRLGLENSIDTSQSGIAAGVGFSRIYGKLWRVPVEIGKTKFHMQFNILDMGVNVILGLDQMKRLGMSISLKRKGLQVGKSFVPFTKPPKEEEILLDRDMSSCTVM